MRTNWFEVLDDVEIPEEIAKPQADPEPEPVHCLCGRFAKYLGGRSYYNGNYSCYSFDVDCSKCGVVTVECV